MEHTDDGAGRGRDANGGRPNLARVRLATASGGDLVPTTVPSRLGRGDRCEPERTFIHDHYVGELLEGTFRPKVRRRVEAIVARLRDDEDIDGVLALLLPSAIVAELPAFNTTALHVDAIVNYLWA